MSSAEDSRVAFVAYTEYPSDSRVRREAETLAHAGYRIDVIAVRSHLPRSPLDLGGGTLYELPIPIKRGGKTRYLFQYAVFFLLSSTLLLYLHVKQRYAFVHVHSLPDFQVFCAAPERLLGTPVFLDLHEALPEILAARFRLAPGSLLYWGAGILEQASTRFATHVIVANEGIAAAVVSRGACPGRITPIYNVGGDTPDLASSIRVARELSLPAGTPIVHAGGINPERDLETVIRGLAQLTNREVFLVAAGAGEEGYIDSLEALAKECGIEGRVRFAGQLSLERARALMSLSAVGLISLERNPLTELAWPTRISEFAESGKPLLVANLRFIRSMLGDAATYYEPGDPRDLADRLTHILGSPREAEARIAKAHEICRKLGPNQMRARLLEVYRGYDRRWS